MANREACRRTVLSFVVYLIGIDHDRAETVPNSLVGPEPQHSSLHDRPFGGPARPDASLHITSDHTDDIIKKKATHGSGYYPLLRYRISNS